MMMSDVSCMLCGDVRNVAYSMLHNVLCMMCEDPVDEGGERAHR